MNLRVAWLLVGIGTFASRSVFILALAKRRIPDQVLLALQFVAPAVLGALIVALLIDENGSVAIGVPEVAALGVGALAAHGDHAQLR